ncbi:MAG TPA: helix-turn-helix domain-containing protein [Saprospiraceae bacterium]|nr:helix-turn-helix domain-containing protein [Saprospiraceae bacterium]
MNPKIFEPKIAMTRKEIASIIGVSKSTLYRKLKEAGVRLPPGLLNYHDQITIVNVFVNGFQENYVKSANQNGG